VAGSGCRPGGACAGSDPLRCNCGALCQLYRRPRLFARALLRERHGYRGELRAIGDVLRDQLSYLARCGYDAFALRADQDPEQRCLP